jgi:hypothetical protein
MKNFIALYTNVEKVNCMPICPACNGSGEEWVDWAEATCDCRLCHGKKEVTNKIFKAFENKNRRILRKGRLRTINQDRFNPCRVYRIQVCYVKYNDWDAVQSVEWKTVRVVETARYGLELVRRMNNSDNYHDRTQYRLVSPNCMVVGVDGNEVTEAYGEIHYPAPDDR